MKATNFVLVNRVMTAVKNDQLRACCGKTMKKTAALFCCHDCFVQKRNLKNDSLETNFTQEQVRIVKIRHLKEYIRHKNTFLSYGHFLIGVNVVF